MKIKNEVKQSRCLNCNHEQEVSRGNTFKDELGEFTTCKECNSSYDVK